MHLPESTSWGFLYDVQEYQRACEAAAAQRAQAAASPSSSSASEAEAGNVLGQLANLQLGRPERHRARDAGAPLAPRNALPGIEGSMRLPPSSAASLVKEERHIPSAPHDLSYMPESPPYSSEPYAPREAARHSTAYPTHATHFDPAPRRSGGFMSGLKKGLQQAFSFGCKANSSLLRSVEPMRRDLMFRMDAPSPGSDIHQYTDDAAINAEIVVHQGNEPAEAAAPQANMGSRRRPRDEAQESARWLAGSSMQAEETTLPPPRHVTRSDVHPQDHSLIAQALAGLEANPDVPAATRRQALDSLISFSAWLKQVGKDGMQERLFSDELTFDAWKYRRLGGHHVMTSVLEHLRSMKRSGSSVMQIPRKEQRRIKNDPEADRILIEAALGTRLHYKNSARSFSEWLAQRNYPALTAPGALHSDNMTALAAAYTATGGPNSTSVKAALTQLRVFDVTGATNIKKFRNTFALREMDQRLIGRYHGNAKKQLLDEAQRQGKTVTGRTKVDAYASYTRVFGVWLQEQELRTIASRLHDGTLMFDLELYAPDKRGAKFKSVRKALTDMAAMFPPEAPEVTIARIGYERFLNALGALGPHTTVAEAARRVGADADDLLVFLDARSETGLTQAGQDVVDAFDGRLRQAADAKIALRLQAWSHAAQGTELPSVHTPAGGWPNVYSLSSAGDGGRGAHADTSQEVMQPATQAPSSWPETPPGGWLNVYSLSSTGDGGRGAHADTSQEVMRPARSNSAFANLDSLGSMAHHGGRGWDLDLNTPPASEPDSADAPPGVTGPARSAPEIGYIVGADWVHGPQFASEVLVNGLDNLGLRPTPFMPQTEIQIHGELYAAQLYEGAVWLAPFSSMPETAGPSQAQPLPVGQLQVGQLQANLGTVLTVLNADRGIASGQGLNCLLDSVLQLANNTRRQDHAAPPTRGLSDQAQSLRATLVDLGMVDPQGQIDLYGANGVGVFLADNFGMRIQAIEEDANGGLIAHPVLGQDGPLVHILNTPGHFEPLWPRQG